MSKVILFVLSVLSLSYVVVVDSAPHPHQGIVKPFPGGDPGVKLNAGALKTLKEGKPFKTQIQSGTAGRGMVVQDVKAPTSVVWDRILDFDYYNKMVPKTAESQTYRKEKLRHGQQRIWVRMKVGFPMLKLQFFINHLYDPAKNSLTWTLDYSKKSDLDDSVGFWYVIPHPDNPEHWTRVYYSVEVSMFSWVPKFVVDFMSKQALTDATAWVKKFSELKAGEQGVPQQVQRTKKRSGVLLSLFRPKKGKTDSKDTDEDKAAQQPEKVIPKSKIGLSRYGLVTSVLVLFFYNVHLYLSQ